MPPGIEKLCSQVENIGKRYSRMQWRRAAGDTLQFQTLALQCVKNSLSTVVSVNNNLVQELCSQVENIGKRYSRNAVDSGSWILGLTRHDGRKQECTLAHVRVTIGGEVTSAMLTLKTPVVSVRFRKQVFVVTGDGFSSLTPALCSCLVAVELTVELSDATLRLHGLTRCRSVLLISAVVTLCHLLLVNVSALDYFAFETTEQSDLENIETG
ncbi:hypothetical protein J6590_098155 [Homalodisca vitripennis]|nr:hypothetical protein J6590_098155 [Homalodisca vitripennis]